MRKWCSLFRSFGSVYRPQAVFAQVADGSITPPPSFNTTTGFSHPTFDPECNDTDYSYFADRRMKNSSLTEDQNAHRSYEFDHVGREQV
jgi:hypothetical protein